MIADNTQYDPNYANTSKSKHVVSLYAHVSNTDSKRKRFNSQEQLLMQKTCMLSS